MPAPLFTPQPSRPVQAKPSAAAGGKKQKIVIDVSAPAADKVLVAADFVSRFDTQAHKGGV